MHKSALITLAGALALSAVGSLHAVEMDIYGRAHVSVDQLDNGVNYNETNFSSNSSRIGFRGEAEAGPVTALIQVEQGINISESGGAFATRDTFVGLKGGFGLVRLGKFDTPFKKARGSVNLFGEQIGDLRNLARAGEVVVDEGLPTEVTLRTRFDERTPNTVHYRTPEFSGLTLDIAYSLHEGDSATPDADQGVVSTSLSYEQGPLDMTLAWEQHDEDRSGGERNAVRLAAAYRVVDPLRLLAFYQQAEHEAEVLNGTLDSEVFGGGAEFAVTETTYLKGMYLSRTLDVQDSDSGMLALGVEHRLDRAVRVYLNYASVDNDNNVALVPWQQGRTLDVAGVAGETASAVSAGVRFDF